MKKKTEQDKKREIVQIETAKIKIRTSCFVHYILEYYIDLGISGLYADLLVMVSNHKSRGRMLLHTVRYSLCTRTVVVPFTRDNHKPTPARVVVEKHHYTT